MQKRPVRTFQYTNRNVEVPHKIHEVLRPLAQDDYRRLKESINRDRVYYPVVLIHTASNEIITLPRQRGWTQEEVADTLRMDRSRVSRLERKGSNVKIHNASMSDRGNIIIKKAQLRAV